MRLTLILAALVIAVSPGSAAPAAERPNIVFILIDDMGYGDIGPFGSTKNRTPNLDRMAREGMRLTNFYAAPVCSVSRAQVMTGCYGARVSIPGVLGPRSRTGINPAEHTVAELLKDQGYATMCIGKWHPGHQPPFFPTRHGFDHYLGLSYSNDMGRKLPDGRNVVPLVRDEKVIELLEGPGQDGLVARYTNEAVNFIRENKHHAFFLYLPHTAVHVPLHPRDAFRGKSHNGRYGDWVEEVDWGVGRVLDTLRELSLSENTLVIFSSDNGPWLTKGADGGEAGLLRGGKGSTFEGGVREPTIAWWPGKIAPGSACDAVAGNIDLLPTFVAVAGGALPTDRKIDGSDISGLLLGKTTESPREAHYYFKGYKLEAVRSGKWKLALVGQQQAGSGKKRAALPRPRLCDLDVDIAEQTDVSAQHPDVVKRLLALAEPMKEEIGDGSPGRGVRKPGVVDEPTLLFAGAAGKPKPRAAAPAAQSKPLALEALGPGDVVPAAAAPQVANCPFTISCEVTPAQPDSTGGVIVAHGGISTGYALYLKDGRVVFAVRTGRKLSAVRSEDPLNGTATIEAHLAADGSMTLSLNGKPPARGKAPGLLAKQPAEDFCVGFDNRRPVGDYDGAPVFHGTIRNLKLTTGD